MTKSELEEKIKNGESVWLVYRKSFIHKVDFSNTKNQRFRVQDDRLVLGELEEYTDPYYNKWLSSYIDLKDIFATEKQASWELEFGNIERTESLRLPTWEEFNKLKTKLIDFPHFDFIANHIEYRLLGHKKDNEIELIEPASHKLPIFESTYTKENYTEACRLAKKLFMGEKE